MHIRLEFVDPRNHAADCRKLRGIDPPRAEQVEGADLSHERRNCIQFGDHLLIQQDCAAGPDLLRIHSGSQHIARRIDSLCFHRKVKGLHLRHLAARASLRQPVVMVIAAVPELVEHNRIRLGEVGVNVGE